MSATYSPVYSIRRAGISPQQISFKGRPSSSPSRIPCFINSCSVLSCSKEQRPSRFSTGTSKLQALTRQQGPVSQEDTQTDFGQLDVLNNTVAPSTSIDACLSDGFQLNSGLKVTGGSGVLLIAGEAFAWRPFEGRRAPLINAKGQWECDDEAWGVLDLVWPKPGTHREGCRV